ncbi:MAG: sn-glycerol-3-phosphate ABC transporter ATP-binding protein UgpC [Myxococcota bacterium]
MAEVSIRGLKKRFGETEVLRGVDVAIPDGAFAVLVGPSGCGKSTLLRLIAGLETADGGAIEFDRDDVTGLPPRERDLAMVFQSYALYPHLSVRENLAFGLKLRKVDPGQVAVRVEQAAAMLGLEGLLDRMPKALSGGQRQRVAMGRAIVRRPRVFLFDEPLSNLDAALRAQVRLDIRRLHDAMKTTSVYVTHDQVEAMTLADLMFILNGGRVEQAGPPLELYDRPQSKFVAGFLGSPAMNFLRGQLGSDRRVRVGEQPLPCPKVEAESGEVWVGVRPHHWHAASPDARGAVEMVVDYVEALGDETFAYGKVSGQALVARLSPETVVEPTSRLKLRVEARSVHLFSIDTERSLLW